VQVLNAIAGYASSRSRGQKAARGRLHRIENRPGDLVFELGKTWKPRTLHRTTRSACAGKTARMYAGLIGREGAVDGVVSRRIQAVLAHREVETGGLMRRKQRIVGKLTLQVRQPAATRWGGQFQLRRGPSESQANQSSLPCHRLRGVATILSSVTR